MNIKASKIYSIEDVKQLYQQRKIDGVIGSRMTGAGFGGCTVSLVKEDAVDCFIREVGKAYEEKIGYAASFYVSNIGDGGHEIK